MRIGQHRSLRLEGGQSVPLFESRMCFRSFIAALRYANEYIESDVLLSASGENISSVLIFAQTNKQKKRQEHGELNNTPGLG